MEQHGENNTFDTGFFETRFNHSLPTLSQMKSLLCDGLGDL
jgi:hypothetical protein